MYHTVVRVLVMYTHTVYRERKFWSAARHRVYRKDAYEPRRTSSAQSQYTRNSIIGRIRSEPDLKDLESFNDQVHFCRNFHVNGPTKTEGSEEK